MDVNKVWLSGICVTQPVMTILPSKTPLLSFTLQVNEQYNDKHGVLQFRPTLIRIETLGRSAEAVMQRVRQGQRYYVDGYIRQDKTETYDYLKIRTYAVHKDESQHAQSHDDGLRRAVDILKRSRDKEAALQALEELLSMP